MFTYALAVAVDFYLDKKVLGAGCLGASYASYVVELLL